MDNAALIAAASQALRHFVHLDESNAAIHCNVVRYSPITFDLASALAACDDVMEIDLYVDRVMTHVGQYAVDLGR